MSTQFYTQDQPAPTQPGTRRGGPSRYRIAAIAIGAVAAATPAPGRLSVSRSPARGRPAFRSEEISSP
jgi:hypothetical protein